MKSIRAKLKHTKPISGASKLFNQTEKRHIQAHLAVTELRLRVAKVGSPEIASKRRAVIDILHFYWRNGVFPVNTYQKYVRTPVFIDDKGTYCAVGHLMAQTGHSGLAHEIDEADKFVVLDDVNDEKLDAWLHDNGLKHKEAALIQPGYGGFTLERATYTLQDKILAIVTLVACLALVALVLVALRVVRNKSLAVPVKRVRLIQASTAAVAIIAGLVFFLPTPSTAVHALLSPAVQTETVHCGGWNTPRGERPAVCNEFEQKGSVPGWREVECEADICLQ